MVNAKWNKDKTRIILNEAPKRPLRLTATRLGSVLGLNAWATPFSAWCEITRTYKEPFTDSKYTIAGKVIEPIITEYCKKVIDNRIVSPEDYYGRDLAKVRYNFYPNIEVFGGMWDAKIVNDKGGTDGVLEIKTSSRPQDWVNGVPLEKLVQALLYSYLENSPITIVPVAFLSDEDYIHPERFVVKEGENFKFYTFVTDDVKIPYQGKQLGIKELVPIAKDWWYSHVEEGVSPVIDAKRDAKIIKALNTLQIDSDDETNDIYKTINDLKVLTQSIEKIKLDNKLTKLESKAKKLKEQLKTELTNELGKDDKYVKVNGWELTQTVKLNLDEKQLKADGIYDKYLKESVSYTLRQKKETK